MSDLEHLLNLARRGRHPGASGGERRAWLIVECLLENATGLDDCAANGIVKMTELIQGDPMSARDAIREFIGLD